MLLGVLYHSSWGGVVQSFINLGTFSVGALGVNMVSVIFSSLLGSFAVRRVIWCPDGVRYLMFAHDFTSIIIYDV